MSGNNTVNVCLYNGKGAVMRRGRIFRYSHNVKLYDRDCGLRAGSYVMHSGFICGGFHANVCVKTCLNFSKLDAGGYCIIGGALFGGGLGNNRLSNAGGCLGIGSQSGDDRKRVHLSRLYRRGMVTGGVVCTMSSQSVFVHGCAASKGGGCVNNGVCFSPAGGGRG